EALLKFLADLGWSHERWGSFESISTHLPSFRLGKGLTTHKMRRDAKPSAVPPLVNVRVTSIPNFTGEPPVPVTGVDDRDVAQNPHQHVDSLSLRPRIRIGDTLEKRFAIQQGAVRCGDIKVLGKILRIPAYV